MLPKREKTTDIHPYPIQPAPLSVIARTYEAMRKAWPELDHTPMPADTQTADAAVCKRITHFRNDDNASMMGGWT
ncbi:hypothetical protein IU449_18340 [Nocardia higoensis]|uniref:Uncharacterized protein n=1 Tax=Nocardia higoensis TaxID=228599 RepID=A0ABS0DDH5_9NOCA|nr:hypothetical protein [Nocardia higoensis]MBF6356479.1 hypothetical protein [Nocardia higoensis]